jgi:hypothetical protein
VPEQLLVWRPKQLLHHAPASDWSCPRVLARFCCTFSVCLNCLFLHAWNCAISCEVVIDRGLHFFGPLRIVVGWCVDCKSLAWNLKRCATYAHVTWWNVFFI